MTTWVDAGGRLVDRDAVLAELHPPLERVAGESPSAPDQRRAKAEWESWRRHVTVVARQALADAEAEVAEFVREREAAKWAPGRLDHTLSAYVRARHTPGPHSLGRVA